MIEPKLLAMLRCPSTGSELKLAEKTLVSRINQAIDRGTLRDRGDQKISQAIDGGLVNNAGDRLYPIRGNIPAMIVDESIDLGKL